jgi:hypothetical protein
MSAGGVCPAESVATGVRRRGRTQSAAERAHKPDSRPHVKTNAPETGLANRRISTPRALKPAPHAPNRGATRPRPSTHGAAWSSRRHQRAGRGARAPRKAPNASEEPRLEQRSSVRTRAGWGARAPKRAPNASEERRSSRRGPFGRARVGAPARQRKAPNASEEAKPRADGGRSAPRSLLRQPVEASSSVRSRSRISRRYRLLTVSM